MRCLCGLILALLITPSNASICHTGLNLISASTSPQREVLTTDRRKEHIQILESAVPILLGEIERTETLLKQLKIGNPLEGNDAVFLAQIEAMEESRQAKDQRPLDTHTVATYQARSKILLAAAELTLNTRRTEALLETLNLKDLVLMSNEVLRAQEAGLETTLAPSFEDFFDSVRSVQSRLLPGKLLSRDELVQLYSFLRVSKSLVHLKQLQTNARDLKQKRELAKEPLETDQPRIRIRIEQLEEEARRLSEQRPFSGKEEEALPIDQAIARLEEALNHLEPKYPFRIPQDLGTLIYKKTDMGRCCKSFLCPHCPFTLKNQLDRKQSSAPVGREDPQGVSPLPYFQQAKLLEAILGGRIEDLNPEWMPMLFLPQPSAQ